jgi:hypothetical protein
MRGVFLLVIIAKFLLPRDAGADAAGTVVECDATIIKRDICAPFDVYEWGLSRCIVFTGEHLDFGCAALENVNVRSHHVSSPCCSSPLNIVQFL